MNQHFNNIDYCKADKIPIAGDHDFVLPLLDKHVELLHDILIQRVTNDDEPFLADNASYFIDNVLVRAMLAGIVIFDRISNALLILQVGWEVHCGLIVFLGFVVFETRVVMLHGDTQSYQSVYENLCSSVLQTIYTADNAFSNVDIKILHCGKKRVIVNFIYHCEIFHGCKYVKQYVRIKVKPVIIPSKYIAKAQILLEYFLFSNHLLYSVYFGT